MAIARTRILNFLGFNPTGDLAQFTYYTSRRRRPVFYLAAPALKPPSEQQLHQRNKFRNVGRLWRALHPDQRADWLAAAPAAGLRITGYNLFTWWSLKRHPGILATIARHSGVTLPPPAP